MGRHCLTCTCKDNEPTENQTKLSKHKCVICFRPGWPHEGQNHDLLLRLKPRTIKNRSRDNKCCGASSACDYPACEEA